MKKTAKDIKEKEIKHKHPKRAHTAAPTDQWMPIFSSTYPIAAGYIALAVIVFIAFIPALFAGYVWDDDNTITKNTLLKSFDGLVKIWTSPAANTAEFHYWPFVYTIFWTEYHLWGTHPFGFHLVNILFHIINTLLLWKILRRFLPNGAWLAAAIFGLHPVHVESVAWVVELKDVLSGMFYLLAFLYYLNFEKDKKWSFYGISLLLFVCALLSKSIVVSFPIALLLYLVWKKSSLNKHDIFRLIPFISIAIAITLFDMHITRQKDTLTFALSPLERLLIATHALWFYAGKVLFPFQLITFYPKWQNVLHSIISYISIIASLAVIVFLFIKRKVYGNGPLVLVLFFIITLIPTLSFVDFSFMFYSYVADRFQYLASIGLIILIVAIINKFWGNKAYRDRFFSQAVTFIIILVLGILTWHQAGTYKDMITLFSHTIEINPNSATAHLIVGEAYRNEKKFSEALPYLEKAVTLKPDYAQAHSNLGFILYKLGKIDEGIKELKEAIRLNPKLTPLMYYDIANALNTQNKNDEAIYYLKEGIKLDPDNALIQYNLGTGLLEKGNYDEAIIHLQKSLENDPSNISSYNNIGTALFKKGNYNDAIAYYKKSLELNPRYVVTHNNLANALLKAGNSDEALSEYMKVAELEPRNGSVYIKIGDILYQQGKIKEAYPFYQRAVLAAEQLKGRKGQEELLQEAQKRLKLFQ